MQNKQQQQKTEKPKHLTLDLMLDSKQENWSLLSCYQQSCQNNSCGKQAADSSFHHTQM